MRGRTIKMKHHYIAKIWVMTFGLIAFSHGLSKGDKTSCQDQTVYTGETAQIICDFGRDLDPSNTVLSVDRRGSLSKNQVPIVECFPANGNTSDCRNETGYRVITVGKAVVNPLVIEILNVSKDFEGSYECHLLPSKSDNVTPCLLNVIDRPPTTPTTQPPLTSKRVTTDVSVSLPTKHPDYQSADDRKEQTSDGVAVPVAVAVPLITVTAVTAVFILKRKKILQGKGGNPVSLVHGGQPTRTLEQPNNGNPQFQQLLPSDTSVSETVLDMGNEGTNSESCSVNDDDFVIVKAESDTISFIPHTEVTELER